MNVGELLKERDRLLEVIEEAKSARAKLKQLNSLIAMYGDQTNISLLDDETVRRRVAKTEHERQVRRSRGVYSRNKKIKCGKCGNSYIGAQGLAAHNRAAHGGKAKTA